MKTNSDRCNGTSVSFINTIKKLVKKILIKYATRMNIYFIEILYKIRLSLNMFSVSVK